MILDTAQAKSIVLPSGKTSQESIPRLELPRLDTATDEMLLDAIRQAERQRCIIGVCGSKGVGKTMAIRKAVDEFNAPALRGEAGATRAEWFPLPEDQRRYTIASLIHRKVTGTPPLAKRKGKTIPDGELLGDLANLLLDDGVSVLVFDEGERISSDGLEAICDVFNLAKEIEPPHTVGAGGVRTSGLGIVLVGTDGMAAPLLDWEEHGERLLPLRRIRDLTHKEAAGIYVAFIPGIQAQAEAMGVKFLQMILERVARGRPLAFRTIASHCREYIHRMDPKARSRADLFSIGLDEDVFIDAAVATIAKQRKE